ncbi:hypothetical protein [Micromonospora sp. DT233]|uniref:hypothetical protein n=1 Tax=Micromonospora sp. DT233 TaxID=3393432 RepID=UPI003CEEC299
MKLAEQDVSGVTRLSLIAAWLGVLLGGLILILDTMSYEFRTDTPRPEPTVSPSGQDTSLTTPRPTPPSVWKPSPGVEVDNEHGEYMKTLRVDRNALYSGTASARLHQHVEVGKSFPLALAVCGNEQRVCDIAPFAGGLSSGSAPAAPAPAEKAGASKDVPLGAVKVGGRVQVKLTSYGGDAVVVAAGPAEQVITAKSDVAEWRWSVTAKNASRLNFQISVTTLRGDSNVALFPTRYFNLAVDVKDTFAHRTGVVLGGAGKFLVGAGTGAAALGTAIIGYLTYRRGRRGEEAGQESVGRESGRRAVSAGRGKARPSGKRSGRARRR